MVFFNKKFSANNGEDIILPRFLQNYKNDSFETKLKVKFIFFLCLIMIAFVFPAMYYTLYIHVATEISPEVYIPILIGEASGVILLFVALLFLKTGHHNISAHLILIFSTCAVWLVMIMDRSSLLTRINTGTYLLAILTLMPVFFTKKRYILLYCTANIIFLWCYVAYFLEFNFEIVDYLADYSIAIIFIGIVAHNIMRIYRTLLDRSEAEIKKLKKTEVALSKEKDKLLEAQKLVDAAQQYQKLEAVGTLAGGIAHDFNNLLTGIYGYIGLAADESKEKSVKNMLEQATASIHTARSLTQQLLTFSKGGSPIMELQPLVPFITDSVKFVLSGSKIVANYEINNDLLWAKYDRNQMTQVIHNVVLNAVQAIPDGGKITVSAQNEHIEKTNHFSLKTGNYIKISIADNGIGIPERDIQKVFDPFFTTKEEGHGLGLAMCYSIVNKHKGMIDVDSTEGKGSTFHIYLPAQPPLIIQEEESDPGDKRCTAECGKILVLDDDKVVAAIVSRIVSKLGYETVVVHSGSDALEEFSKAKESDDPFKALIFDLTLPGSLSGKDVIEKIRETDKEIIAFVSTGYSEDPVVSDPESFGFNDSISKPFEIGEITEKLLKHL
jgi:signal transduction histidine kinase/ActR/RegA family two-component response regulator